MATRRDPEERFWAKVARGPECWEWQGASSYGYGIFYDHGSHTVRAHRFSWQLANGPLLPGQGVYHHCDNKRCVRPDHLFSGVHQDNLSDLVRKRRQAGYRPGCRRVRGRSIELRVYAGRENGRSHYMSETVPADLPEAEIEQRLMILRLLAESRADCCRQSRETG